MAGSEPEKVPDNIPSLVITGSQIEPSLEEERKKYEQIAAEGAGIDIKSFKSLDGSEIVVFRIDLFVDYLSKSVSLEMTRQDAIILRNRIDEAFRGNDLPGYA